MAKKSKNELKKGLVKSEQNTSSENESKQHQNKVIDEQLNVLKSTGGNKFSFLFNTTAHQWIIFLFAFLLYANAIPNDYAVDDSIVIQRNMFTKKGIKGMAGIWGKDTFVGFFGDERNLVSGGRYRPFTVALFAIENQLFGKVVKNEGAVAVSTNITSTTARKDVILASLGNPKNSVGKAVNDTVTFNIIIEPGSPIPDKDGDIIYLGNPHISHAINGIFFGLLCWLIYLWVIFMFDPKGEKKSSAIFIAFTTAMLFAAHPLHTEAVANIKGRDEVIVTLFSVLSVFMTMKAVGNKNWLYYMIAAVIAFFLALFSKESAIPFLVIIPAAIYFFRQEASLQTIAIYTAPFFVAVVVFWFGIRNPILKWAGKTDPPIEYMNDPFMKLTKTATGNEYVKFDDKVKCKDCMTYKYGLILHTWLEYVKLLAVPHPLTNDYYPKHIGVAESTIKPGSGENIAELKDGNGKVRYVKDNIPKLGSPFVTLSILFHLALAFFAVYGLMKRKAYAFAIIFYAATFSVVSNLLFPIGTLMAERFMFMPSIGFSLLCGMGLAQLATKGSYFDISKIMMPLSVFLIVTVLYSFKTFSRNPDWKDDYSLFTKDILVSANSAKLNNAVSGVLQDRASKPELSVAEKDELYRRALYHSDNAINLHPTYNNAWLLKGNAYYYLAKIKEAKTDSLRNAGNQEAAFKGYNEVLSFYNNSLNSYKEVERLRPDHPDVPINLTAAYRDRGKLLGEKLNRLNEAVADLEMSNKYGNQKDVETLRLLGVGCGIMGMTYAQQKDIIKAFEWHTKAVNAFQKALDIAPNFVATLYNLEVAYRQILEIMPSKRDEYIPKIEEVNKKWKELDPNYNPMGQAQKTDNKVKTEEKPNEKKVSK